MARHAHLLRRDDALLVVIDMQEPFLRVIHDRDRLAASVLLLIHAARVLDIPILATIQNAARLGGVAPEIADAFPASQPAPLDKLTFSCLESPPFRAALDSSRRRQVVLCGLETHICVAQTALDLVASGYQAHVAADAVSSRTLEKHKLGMERIRDSGALPCAAEAAVYEWLAAAGTPEFKAILPLAR